MEHVSAMMAIPSSMASASLKLSNVKVIEYTMVLESVYAGVGSMRTLSQRNAWKDSLALHSVLVRMVYVCVMLATL